MDRRLTLKTYSHLLDRRRRPTEYEIGTSGLLYYPGRGGFEVDVPLGDWYERHRVRSAFACRDWEQFADPRETTYAKYTSLQRDKEVFVDGILASIDASGHDRTLPAAWIATLERGLAPLRYPVHGFQMIACYLGQMAPGGRITVAAAFQAADEARRIQRIAYRMRQLRETHPGFGERSRAAWQDDPLWQPLREALERLLVAYDWGEAFVGLNLCLKPAIDSLFLGHLGEAARASGDWPLREVLSSLGEDCRWHRDWSGALVAAVLRDTPATKAAIEGWIDRWHPLAARAALALAALLGDRAAAATAGLRAESAEYLGSLGLRCPG